MLDDYYGQFNRMAIFKYKRVERRWGITLKNLIHFTEWWMTITVILTECPEMYLDDFALALTLGLARRHGSTGARRRRRRGRYGHDRIFPFSHKTRSLKHLVILELSMSPHRKKMEISGRRTLWGGGGDRGGGGGGREKGRGAQPAVTWSTRVNHNTRVHHNALVYQYRLCHTMPLYCTGTLSR